MRSDNTNMTSTSKISNLLKTDYAQPATFRLNIEDLSITPESLLKVMNFKEDQTLALYEKSLFKYINVLSSKADIRIGYIIIPPNQFQLKKTALVAKDTHFKTGKIIAGQLTKSETIALFVVSAGSIFENLSRRLFDQGDFPGGYVVDLIGSEIAEAAADRLELEILSKLSPYKLGITNRYSPGYCGWNVAEQFKLFSLLPKNFCGVTITENALMVPLKSISGISGIGSGVERIAYPCDVCNVKDCYRRLKSSDV
jgi:hypothetical protein